MTGEVPGLYKLEFLGTEIGAPTKITILLLRTDIHPICLFPKFFMVMF